MNGLRPDTVAIRTLRIQSAPGSNAILQKQVAERLRREIEWGDWPESPEESWVFVRQIRAHGPSTRLTRALIHAVHQEVKSGGSDNVMRFAHLVELLAALLTDLVKGQASRHWYWQRWAHLFRLPTPKALVNLLAEHSTRIASVCARLARQQTLAQVWLNLDKPGAYQLAMELAWRGGAMLPSTDRIEAVMTQQPTDKIEVSPVRINNVIRERWAPVLQSCALADPRLQLALVLIGQEAAPLMLQRNPARTLAQLAKTLNPALGQVRQTATDSEPVSADSFTPWNTSSEAPFQADTENHTAETPVRLGHINGTLQSGGGTQQTPAAEESTTPKHQQSPEPEAPTPPYGADAAKFTNDLSRRQPAQGDSIQWETETPSKPFQSTALRFNEAPLDPAFDHFHTGQGGLLYLLNFLNRTETLALVGEYWEQLPNGWGWLYRLGQELQLDETDPIVPYIATQLGFDHPGELEQLPSLPGRKSLLMLARHWYGRAGLWQPELLRLNARIRTSPSHVDLYAPLNAVRLPVRLAGLDINPGWLPWLGRVVNFHYD